MSAAVLVASNTATLFAGIGLGYGAAKMALRDSGIDKEMTSVKDTEPKRKRAITRQNVIVTILFLGFIATSVYSGISNSRSTEAIRQASQAQLANRQLQLDNKKLLKCIESYTNGLADALDRRNNDNALLQEVDAKRDRIVVQLAEASANPARTVEVPSLLVRLSAATKAKQRATEQVARGRQEKSYPNAPREVCPNVD